MQTLYRHTLQDYFLKRPTSLSFKYAPLYIEWAKTSAKSTAVFLRTGLTIDNRISNFA